MFHPIAVQIGIIAITTAGLVALVAHFLER